ncbi:hypothetical protein IAT38_007548 [Cryptococcus sp. DSM 104549]
MDPHPVHMNTHDRKVHEERELWKKKVDKLEGERIGEWTVASEVLGVGAFGYVKEGVRGDERVALKFIQQRDGLCDPHDEAAAMRELDHPHVMKLLSQELTPVGWCLTLEHCPNGPLATRLQEGLIIPPLARHYFRQVVEAIHHCHTRGIYHLDIKPHNILVDSTGELKVGDFGLATRRPADGGFIRMWGGTAGYQAPEAENHFPYHGDKADVYSCGVLLWHMLVGSIPFSEVGRPHPSLTAEQVKARHYVMDEKITGDARDLVEGMLEIDPARRVSMTNILRHPYLSHDTAIRPILAGLSPPPSPKVAEPPVAIIRSNPFVSATSSPRSKTASLSDALAVWLSASARLSDFDTGTVIRVGLSPASSVASGELPLILGEEVQDPVFTWFNTRVAVVGRTSVSLPNSVPGAGLGAVDTKPARWLALPSRHPVLAMLAPLWPESVASSPSPPLSPSAPASSPSATSLSPKTDVVAAIEARADAHAHDSPRSRTRGEVDVEATPRQVVVALPPPVVPPPRYHPRHYEHAPEAKHAQHNAHVPRRLPDLPPLRAPLNTPMALRALLPPQTPRAACLPLDTPRALNHPLNTPRAPLLPLFADRPLPPMPPRPRPSRPLPTPPQVATPALFAPRPVSPYSPLPPYACPIASNSAPESCVGSTPLGELPPHRACAFKPPMSPRVGGAVLGGVQAGQTGQARMGAQAEGRSLETPVPMPMRPVVLLFAEQYISRPAYALPGALGVRFEKR